MNNRHIKQKQTKGAALILFVVLFMFASLTIVLSIGNNARGDILGYRILESGKKSFYSAEAGIEDAVYRHKKGDNYSSTESFFINGTTTNIVRTLVNDRYEIVAVGNVSGATRRSKIVLTIGVGASFNFGMQGGNGGVLMENNSTVLGNVFSNGSVVGMNNNIVYGDIISAGPAGLANGVHATGSVWARTITGSVVDYDAYYQTLTGTLVFGSTCVSNVHCHPGSADQATATLPISDESIDEWKAAAQAGTVIASTSPQCSSGTYTINSDTTLDTVKIECDFIVEGNSTDLYLKGPVWVVGNIDIKNTVTLRVHASSTARSIPIVADKPTDRLISSKIVLQNSSVFVGNGSSSYIFLISQNNSSELGGSEIAINMKNNTTGALLLYAAHGRILVENGSGIKAVTGYQIHTQNNTQIVYESGLMNTLFTSGPGGGYTITSWKEIP